MVAWWVALLGQGLEDFVGFTMEAFLWAYMVMLEGKRSYMLRFKHCCACTGLNYSLQPQCNAMIFRLTTIRSQLQFKTMVALFEYLLGLTIIQPQPQPQFFDSPSFIWVIICLCVITCIAMRLGLSRSWCLCVRCSTLSMREISAQTC